MRVSLVVANNSDLIIQNGWPGDTFSVALNLDYSAPGPMRRAFESVIRTNGVSVSALQGNQETTNQQASLRISFNSTSKTLTAWYDVSGSTNGHTWTMLGSAQINAPGCNWEMDDGSFFRIGLAVDCRNYTVAASDQVYVDNFAVVGGVQPGAPLFSSAGNFVWAKRIAQANLPDDELAIGVALDAATNIYLAGWFDGVNDFGGTTLTSYGGQDAFVAKYNTAGTLQWVEQAGGTAANTEYYSDVARGVGVDGAGNVYVTGGFMGDAAFGPINLPGQNYQDFYLAKYNSGGTPVWVRQGVASGEVAYGTGMVVDSSGNSVVVGYFDGATVSFLGTYASNPGYLTGAYATFIAKFNNSGVPQWAQGLGGGDTYSTTVGMDAVGNCYVGGGFKDALQLGTTTLTAAGNTNGFLAKFDTAGGFQWARQVKGPSMEGGRIGVDASGNCCLVSWVSSGVVDFGGLRITNASSSALYVAKYDTSGNLLWVQQAQCTGQFGFTEGGCAFDSASNCYIPGLFTGTITFGGTTVTNRGGWDIFVAKYDAAGNFKWLQTAGGSGNDTAIRLVVDGANNCYLAGWFQNVAAFGTNVLEAQGYWDLFLAKLGEPVTALQFEPILTVSNGWFQMQLTGPANASVILQASSDLTNWTSVLTNTVPATSLPLSWPMSTNHQQFYRAKLLTP